MSSRRSDIEEAYFKYLGIARFFQLEFSILPHDYHVHGNLVPFRSAMEWGIPASEYGLQHAKIIRRIMIARGRRVELERSHESWMDWSSPAVVEFVRVLRGLDIDDSPGGSRGDGCRVEYTEDVQEESSRRQRRSRHVHFMPEEKL